MGTEFARSTRISTGCMAMLVIALAWLQVPAQAGFISNAPLTDPWVTDGEVSAIVTTPTTVYLGGHFTYVGPSGLGKGVPLNAATGEALSIHPEVNARVLASISDGAGGWYIGGEFTQVGAMTQNRLAHILADGSLDIGWNPGANAVVECLALSGSTLYVGGAFTTIAGQARNGIAAINAGTGQATAWDPNAGTGQVVTLAVSGTKVYVGGLFTTIGGQTRNNIASLDSATGLATSWDPNSSGTVYALVVSGNIVYVGGYFTSIGGQSRNSIAAIDASKGVATPWNPNAGNVVYALALSGSTLYAGGNFTWIGGQTRNNIAAIDTTSGLATAWDPNASGGSPTSVNALALSGTTLYAGGWFTTIGGQTRNNFAALDTATGLAAAWDDNTDGRVYAVGLSGSALYVGGYFSSIGGCMRKGLAAINAATGVPTDWNPGMTGSNSNFIGALALSGTTLYAGGYFSSIGGQARNSLAAIDTESGLVTAWNPGDESSYIYGLAASDTTVYIGGSFSNIGGQPRNRLAAVDAVTGAATAWNPSPSGGGLFIISLLLSGSTVYVGGDYTSIGGQPRNSLAALDATTGAATAWNPNVGGTVPRVHALALSGTKLYAAGQFASVGGLTRNHIAAIDATTGAPTSWNPNAGGNVFALAVSGTTICAGGLFTTIGGLSRSNLAGLDATTGSATAWNPGAYAEVDALATLGSSVCVGGAFDRFGSAAGTVARKGFAVFPPDTTPPTGTIVINNNRSATNSANVTLALTWND